MKNTLKKNVISDVLSDAHSVINRNEIPQGANEVIVSNDDSMEPLIIKGSSQFIHWQPVPDFNGQTMAVRVKNGNISYKKVYYEKGNVRLVSLNEKYKDAVYPANDVQCLGKVIITTNN